MISAEPVDHGQRHDHPRDDQQGIRLDQPAPLLRVIELSGNRDRGDGDDPEPVTACALVRDAAGRPRDERGGDEDDDRPGAEAEALADQRLAASGADITPESACAALARENICPRDV